MAQTEEAQVSAIFSVLGLPTPEEWPELESLPEWSKLDIKIERNDEDFEALLNKCDGDALDLVMKMLSCNPQHRISAEDALRHEWFAQD